MNIASAFILALSLITFSAYLLFDFIRDRRYSKITKGTVTEISVEGHGVNRNGVRIEKYTFTVKYSVEDQDYQTERIIETDRISVGKVAELGEEISFRYNPQNPQRTCFSLPSSMAQLVLSGVAFLCGCYLVMIAIVMYSLTP